MFKIYRILLVIILFFSIRPLSAEGVNWEPFSENSDFGYFFETESVTRPSKDIVWVWVQTNCLSENAREYSTRIWAEKASAEITHVEQSKELYEINCLKKTYKTTSTILYDQENNTIFSSKDELKTGNVEPYTHMELLHGAVCP